MAESMAENRKPQIIFETVEMSAEEINAQNAAYAAMGLDAVVIDVSSFCSKMELQDDGSYKRSQIRKPRRQKK